MAKQPGTACNVKTIRSGCLDRLDIFGSLMFNEGPEVGWSCSTIIFNMRFLKTSHQWIHHQHVSFMILSQESPWKQQPKQPVAVFFWCCGLTSTQLSPIRSFPLLGSIRSSQPPQPTTQWWIKSGEVDAKMRFFLGLKIRYTQMLNVWHIYPHLP